VRHSGVPSEELGGFDAEACLGEHEQCARALAGALREERVLRVRLLQLNDSMGVHARVHVSYDLQGNTCRLGAEMHYVLHTARAGDGTCRDVWRDPYEDVARKERLKARARAHEGEQGVKILAAKIELHPPLRARLGVDQLPGKFAERRRVGVVHVSDVIHNEGGVRRASRPLTTLSPQEYTDEGRERAIKGVPLKVRVTAITKNCAIESDQRCRIAGSNSFAEVVSTGVGAVSPGPM